MGIKFGMGKYVTDRWLIMDLWIVKIIMDGRVRDIVYDMGLTIFLKIVDYRNRKIKIIEFEFNYFSWTPQF